MGNNDYLKDFLDETDNPFSTEKEPKKAIATETCEAGNTTISEEKQAETLQENAQKSEVFETTEPSSEQHTLDGSDSLEAALKKSKADAAERLIGNLVAKNPVFKYASASDPIVDKNVTFDELRKKYETDFPELEEKANVSWTVTYGKICESVSNPTKEKVFEVKAKIEKLDKFLDSLKKVKTDAEKKPDCLVKPFVKAQKKGENTLAMPDYKGFFLNYDDALQSPKVITFIPARDGKVYEIRKNNIGVFQSPARAIGELSEVKEGFTLSLPKIPVFLLYQVIDFFRVISKKYKSEVLVHLTFDTETQKYNVIVPDQKVTSISVDSNVIEYPEEIIHVMDIHSHNIMGANFSSTDNKDEKATRLYGVIRKLDKIMPEIALRASNGGKFIELGADDIFDFDATYPEEWFDDLTHSMAEFLCQSQSKNDKVTSESW